MIFTKPIFLKNDTLILEELRVEHKAPLQELANNEKIWEHVPNISNANDFSEKWFISAIKQRSQEIRLPFIIKLNNNIIGSTSFYEINEDHKRLAIGYTWLHPDHWGTGVNKKIKYLMLSHVFEILKFHRVSFNIDILNVRSCKAIEQLGATKEGILRNHMIRSDLSLRNTIIYSIIDSEWPEIRELHK